MTSFNETVKQINELINNHNKEIARLKEEVEKKAESIISDVCKLFFTEHPYIENIYWHQYTPGFNDGDPCTFRSSDFHITFDLEKLGFSEELIEAYTDELQETEWGGNLSFYLNNDKSYYATERTVLKSIPDFENLENNYRSLVNFLSNIDDFKETLFGNDQTVTLSINGVETEDYYCGY